RLFSGLLLRVIDPYAVVDPERAEIGVVPESDSGCDGDVAHPEIGDVAPEIPKIEKVHSPDVVEAQVSQFSESPEVIDAHLHAAFKLKVAPEGEEGVGHRAQLSRAPSPDAPAPPCEEPPVEGDADVSRPALAVLVLVPCLQLEGKDVVS